MFIEVLRIFRASGVERRSGFCERFPDSLVFLFVCQIGAIADSECKKTKSISYQLSAIPKNVNFTIEITDS